MDQEMTFSLSYEQLTRIAEKNIRECGGSVGISAITHAKEK